MGGQGKLDGSKNIEKYNGGEVQVRHIRSEEMRRWGTGEYPLLPLCSGVGDALENV